MGVRERSDARAAIVAGLAPAFAIFVFGTIYGATVGPRLGDTHTIFASAVVFSGALQFATARLIAEGATLPVVLLAAALLNIRHVLLGAALRPRVGGRRTRRAAIAWFMIDEAAGLALAAERPALVLFVTGAMGYVAWVAGTVLGLYGADLANLESVADAVFPVLFTGLAAMTVRNRSDAFRTVAAAAATIGVAYLLPDVRPVLPAAVAATVSFLGGDR